MMIAGTPFWETPILIILVIPTINVFPMLQFGNSSCFMGKSSISMVYFP
jgi:hypothetical protein